MKHWWHPTKHLPTWSWIETIILTGLVLIIAIQINPNNPFFIQAAFPWVWLAPIILALRYGLGPGLLSLVIVSGAFLWHEHAQAMAITSYRLYLLGGIITTLLCGHFSSLWRTKLERIQHEKDYTLSRLRNLSDDYYMLRLSHERLEQNLISKPNTLRDGLATIRQLLVEQDNGLTPAIATRYISLLSYYCTLRKTALYLCHKNQPEPECIAHIGTKATLHRQDVLVQKALDTQKPAYFAVNQLTPDEKSHYRVVAPLYTGDQQLIALLTIEDLPFMQLNDENLQVLIILLSYFANDLWSVQQSKAILKEYPSCPPAFASELIKLKQLKATLHIDSSLAAIYIEPGEMQETIANELARQSRGLDQTWTSTQNNQIITILFLLPLTNLPAVHAFLERITKLLALKFDLTLNKKGGFARYRVLTNDPTELHLDTLLAKSNDQIQ